MKDHRKGLSKFKCKYRGIQTSVKLKASIDWTQILWFNISVFPCSLSTLCFWDIGDLLRFWLFCVCLGFYSWRNTISGSWFVQALSEVLMKHAQNLDLLTMMTRVNQIVANKFQSNTSNPNMNEKKQIPCVTSMLTKEVYFKSK